ncbi:S10 family serine carboxypeptidase-like protein [Microbispora sp. CA-102843]|uniref:S10 family serine carboxypeptidase-like protein n=1 Tax=Microbispora sp. CA-102843 TaxID=3239952 RepID=UPI003D8B85E8
MPKHYTSRHSAVIGDVSIDFTAEAGRVSIADESGRTLGDAWTFAYVRDGGEAERPVLFLFNGGPGCSSIWLHLGGLGPWRAAVPRELDAAPVARDTLAPSPDALIDTADLVFIDPIDTGFGRLADGVEPAAISSVDRDAAITAQIVRSWLERHNRLESPVYLLGESYGTTRAALTATALLTAEEPVAVSGVAMLGQCVNAQETTQRPGNPVGFIAALPLLAATAWYHGKSAYGALALDEVVRRAHAFAVDEYAAALLTGEMPDPVVERLAGFTGLGAVELRARRLRVDKEEYRRLLLADRGLVVGLTDARYTLPAPAAGAGGPHVDAASVRLDPVFYAAARRLFTEHLGIPRKRRYRVAVAAHERWNYLEDAAVARFGGSAMPSPFALFDYPAHLAALLRANAGARLFFGTGYFDTLTTVGSLEHLLSQYGLPAARLREGRYPAGHMMYTDPHSSAALSADLRAFVREGTA